MRINKVYSGSFAYSRLAQAASKMGHADNKFVEEALGGEIEKKKEGGKTSGVGAVYQQNGGNSKSGLVIQKIRGS